MHKFISTLFFLLSVAVGAQCQSMATIFMLLPASYTPGLDAKQRALLLRDKIYIVPGGNAVETIKYELRLNEKENYLQFGSHFTTGQNGFSAFEIKKLVGHGARPLIVYSHYGGMLRAYDQVSLKLFHYQNKKLVPLKKILVPQTLDISAFLKAGTPDSVKNKLASYISSSYDLDPGTANSIAFRIYFGVNVDDYKEYILGVTMMFTWTGKIFEQKLTCDKTCLLLSKRKNGLAKYSLQRDRHYSCILTFC